MRERPNLGGSGNRPPAPDAPSDGKQNGQHSRRSGPSESNQIEIRSRLAKHVAALNFNPSAVKLDSSFSYRRVEHRHLHFQTAHSRPKLRRTVSDIEKTPSWSGGDVLACGYQIYNASVGESFDSGDSEALTARSFSWRVVRSAKEGRSGRPRLLPFGDSRAPREPLKNFPPSNHPHPREEHRALYAASVGSAETHLRWSSCERESEK